MIIRQIFCLSLKIALWRSSDFLSIRLPILLRVCPTPILLGLDVENTVVTEDV
jgi:hypothetical protein